MIYLNKNQKAFFEILTACPYGCSLEDCPLNDVRKSNSVKDFIYTTQLSDEEVILAIEYHGKCSHQRAKI